MRNTTIAIGLAMLVTSGCTASSEPPTTTTTTRPPPTSTTTTTTPPIEPVTFIAAGDIGGSDDRTGTVLQVMAEVESDFFLVLGDLSYKEIEPATAWCDWVKGFFPTDYPIEIVVGNHEDDDRADGFIREFTPCLPDRRDASGDYGVEYYFDAGPVRVIMVSAGISVDGTAYDYDVPGPRRDWLLATVDEAEAAGLWTVVGMHKVCVTTGNKECDIGEPTMDDLIEHGADVILHAHDHNYQRSHQLGCIDVDVTAEECIVDRDSAHQAEEGTVIVVTGWVGRSGYSVSSADSEAGYFAVIGGPNIEGWRPGFLTVTATETTLTGSWTSAGGVSTDTFVITRGG